MDNKKLLIVLMIGVFVLSVGCLQPQEKKPTAEPGANEILTKSKSSMKDLSYEFSG